MTRLPIVSPREVVAVLKKAGFVEGHRHRSGSHLFLFHPERKVSTTVAMHARDIPPATLKAIIKQTGLTEDEFRALELVNK